MEKFMVLYKAPMSAMEQMANATPEQTAAGMDLWMKWAQKAGSGLIDFGAPLGDGQAITPQSVSSAGSEVVGFSIVESGSANEVADLLRDHPHLHTPGGSIDVFKFLPTPGT